ncbi:MAG: hypothetical protein ABJG41_09655 [Cyclobacteriaceae bacterium]
MILIGEAGGSKTDWRLISKDQIESKTTAGFNAAVDDLSAFISSVRLEFEQHLEAIRQIYFYAAGAGTSENQSDLELQLESVFPVAQVEVQNDLLASSRALYGTDSGMVAILGTGSVVGEYDGSEIIYRVPSLGYILGDEGSGFYLSKLWIQHVLRGTAPDDLAKSFLEQHPDFSEREIIRLIYGEARANGILARYTHFFSQNKFHPFIYGMVYEAFKHCFNAYHLRQEDRDKKWRFSGSIAYYFEEILRQAGSEFDLYIDKVIQSPIEELTNYHQTHG